MKTWNKQKQMLAAGLASMCILAVYHTEVAKLTLHATDITMAWKRKPTQNRFVVSFLENEYV